MIESIIRYVCDSPKRDKQILELDNNIEELVRKREEIDTRIKARYVRIWRCILGR